MRYPQEVIEEVRAGNDIVDVVGGYVALRNRGGNFFGLCPFHNEKTASFSVNSDKQMYHCFGCGAGGNVISFVMQIENYDFLEALRFLADRIRFVLPEAQQGQAAQMQLRERDVLREMHKLAARYYHDNLLAETGEAAAARSYLEERGISPGLWKRFGLGLSLEENSAWDGLLKNLHNNGFILPDMVKSGLVSTGKKGTHYDRFRGRLMFPIMDIAGFVVGFGGRVMVNGDDASKPKYLNSPETPLFDKSRQLYGIHTARKARSKEIIIVEGYMDVISLHQAGYPQTAGVLGTALTAHHARLLKRVNCSSVILLFDRDKAGVQALMRAIPVLLEAGIRVKCLQVTEDVNDPDDYIRKYGAARFGQLLETAKNHAAFRIELLADEYDLENTEQRIKFTQEAAAVLAGIESSIEADAYIRETAKMSGIAPQAISAEMDKQRSKFYSSAPAPRDRPGLRLNLRSKQSERGLIEARKGILSMLLAYPELSRKMRDFLSPEEIGEGPVSKLLELAYQNAEAGRVSAPADIIAQFETLEEQQQIAEILRDTPHFEDENAMEKALNDMWRCVKQAWINKLNSVELEQKNEEIDINAIISQGKALRNLEKQYITIVNG